MIEDNSQASGEAFWQAALEFYEWPGVAAALLALQDDHAGDVMATLWAMTALAGGRALGPGDIRAFYDQTAGARADASRRRAERRALKGGEKLAYAAAKARELEAERAVATSAPDPLLAGDAMAEPAARRAATLRAFVRAQRPTPSAAAIVEYDKLFEIAAC